MALTDYESSASDGTLPNTLRASQVQYRRFINWVFDSNTLGIGFHQGTGKWKIRVEIGDGLYLEQEVELTLQVVMLGAPGLLFYTWQFVREKITTTWIDDEAVNVISVSDTDLTAPLGVVNSAATSGRVDDANDVTLTAEQVSRIGSPSWAKTLGGEITSEFGTMIPGGGSGVGVGEIIIDAFWQSPLYVFDLPVGSKLDVVMDAWGLGVSTRPEWQWRFEEAGSDFAAIIDRQGAIRMVTVREGALDLRLTYNSQKLLQRRAFIEDATQPVIWRDATNRIYVFAFHDTSWKLWYSDLGSYDIAAVTYTYTNLPLDSTGGEVGTPVSLWPEEYTEADIAPRPSRGYVSCALRDGNVYFLSSSDGIVPGAMKQVGPHNDLKCRVLVGKTSDGRERLEILDGGDVHFQSLDGGLEWSAIL